MITEKRLEDSLKYLADTDEESASANANVKYLDRLLKRKKALHITGNQEDKSISAKEQTYYEYPINTHVMKDGTGDLWGCICSN